MRPGFRVPGTDSMRSAEPMSERFPPGVDGTPMLAAVPTLGTICATLLQEVISPDLTGSLHGREKRVLRLVRWGLQVRRAVETQADVFDRQCVISPWA